MGALRLGPGTWRHGAALCHRDGCARPGLGLAGGRSLLQPVATTAVILSLQGSFLLLQVLVLRACCMRVGCCLAQIVLVLILSSLICRSWGALQGAGKAEGGGWRMWAMPGV